MEYITWSQNTKLDQDKVQHLQIMVKIWLPLLIFSEWFFFFFFLKMYFECDRYVYTVLSVWRVFYVLCYLLFVNCYFFVLKTENKSEKLKMNIKHRDVNKQLKMFLKIKNYFSRLCYFIIFFYTKKNKKIKIPHKIR